MVGGLGLENESGVAALAPETYGGSRELLSSSPPPSETAWKKTSTVFITEIPASVSVPQQTCRANARARVHLFSLGAAGKCITFCWLIGEGLERHRQPLSTGPGA